MFTCLCAGRKDRFLDHHDAALRVHFGELPAPPKPSLPALPASFDSLVVQHQSQDGVVSAFAENVDAAHHFLSLYQEETGAEFSVTERNLRKLSRVERSCRFAGQPDGPETARIRRQAEQHGPGKHSSRRVGCCAKVIFWQPSDKSAEVRVEVRLGHSGHQLGCDEEITSLKLDPW